MHDSSRDGVAVAMVHYHLSGGGVSRVIEISSAALAARGIPHVILTGEAPPQPGAVPLRVVAGLGYASGAHAADAAALAERMRSAACDALGDGPHIWHFHNHLLGKNQSLPDAVAILARRGERMILQIHDLAEDGRPENHPLIADAAMPYPLAPHVFYAFINRRDQARFHAAGLPPGHSAYIPNPIEAPVSRASSAPISAPPLVLCAARGIRRKNLGEIFLLAALSPQGVRYATTLPPLGAQWLPIYHEWQAFGQRHGLAVELGVVGRVSPASGRDASLSSWHDRTSHYLTTSVAEGFGLGYLEPVAMGKPVFGRNLPSVTDDFAAAGIRPGRFYERLLVPLSWFDASALENKIRIACCAWGGGYGRVCSRDFADEVCAALLGGPHVDFGNLPEDMQRSAILRVLDGCGDDILVAGNTRTVPARAWLAEVLANCQPACLPDALSPFSPTAHAERLAALYALARAATPAPPQALDPARVLDQYVRPPAFHFLRC
jgi:glycosyltransferase involved in cell wall biosynthesis